MAAIPTIPAIRKSIPNCGNNILAPPPSAAPHTNTSPGVTTGAAPARPQNPPSSVPTGQDVNHAGNPPANNAPANK